MSDIQGALYCANHPGVETSLRCNRCEKPICSKCAVLTPTGYRCKECVRNQQKVFDNALWYDFLTGFVTAGVLAGLGSFAIQVLPLGFLTIFIAPGVGMVIAEAVRLVVRRRRSRRLFQLVAGAVVLGSLPFLFVGILSGSVFAIIWQAVFLSLATSTAYYRLRGIRIK